MYLAPGEGVTMLAADLPAPPARLWHLLTAPHQRMRWQPLTERVDEFTQGARGVGTTNHCVHGDASVVEEEILDWRPFRYFSHRGKGIFGVALFTTELTPVADGAATRVSWRMLPEGGAAALAAFAPMVPELQRWYGAAVEGLTGLLRDG